MLSTRRKIYLFSFLDEVGPVYAMYSVWFLDSGISPTELSIVFGLWAAITILLEVPSGALADLVDKRLVVGAALALRAFGIALWFLYPIPAVMYVGAGLWAVHSALASGAWEALMYEQLERDGDAAAFPEVLALAGQFSHVGVAVGTLGGAALLEYGTGIPLLGWFTVGAHFLAVPILLALPRTTPGNSDDEDRDASWSDTIRLGRRAIASSAPLMALVTIAVVLETTFVFDDYVPAIARLRGTPDSLIPLIVLVVWIGLIAGGELAARRPNMSGRGVALGLFVAAAAILAAFVSESASALLLIAIGYGLMNTAWVLTQSRLLALAPPAQRATVRSFVGLVGGVCHIAIFGIVAAFTFDDDPSFGLAVVTTVMVPLALFVALRMPEAEDGAPARVE